MTGISVLHGPSAGFCAQAAAMPVTGPAAANPRFDAPAHPAQPHPPARAGPTAPRSVTSQVRGEADSATSLYASRAVRPATTSATRTRQGHRLAAHRLRRAPTVQTHTTACSRADQRDRHPATAVDTHAHAVLSTASSRLPGDHESANNTSGNDDGDANRVAMFSLISATQVRILRASASSAATFTFSAVQVEPLINAG